MFIDEKCSRTTEPLSTEEILSFVKQIPEWTYDSENKKLTRCFTFSRYLDGPDFAIKLAQIAEAQDHHPDIHIYYKKCAVDFTTHSAKGVSRNDFICAALIDQMHESA